MVKKFLGAILLLRICQLVLIVGVFIAGHVHVEVYFILYLFCCCVIRYGKEDRLVSLFGVMQALVSIVQDDKDNLRSWSTAQSNHISILL